MATPFTWLMVFRCPFAELSERLKANAFNTKPVMAIARPRTNFTTDLKGTSSSQGRCHQRLYLCARKRRRTRCPIRHDRRHTWLIDWRQRVYQTFFKARIVRTRDWFADSVAKKHDWCASKVFCPAHMSARPRPIGSMFLCLEKHKVASISSHLAVWYNNNVLIQYVTLPHPTWPNKLSMTYN